MLSTKQSAIAILVVVVVLVLVLGFGFLFSNARLPTSVAMVTPTVKFAKGSPPPGTPTGEIPTPLPTPSKDELRKAPTAEYPPDIPTLEPITDIDAVAPTLAPVLAVAPSEEWLTYTDPNLGFSFSYPSNWYVTAPDSLSPDYVSKKGVAVAIKGYIVEGDTKGGVPQNTIKIDLHAVPEFGEYQTIDSWFSDYQKRELGSADDDPTYSISEPEYMAVESARLVKWTQQGAGEPAGGLYAATGKDRWLYFFSTYPATSDYAPLFSKIIETFKVQ